MGSAGQANSGLWLEREAREKQLVFKINGVIGILVCLSAALSKESRQ